jgi:ketosteroid isomerase-like protein
MMTSALHGHSDQDVIRQLNRAYVEAFLNSDADWYAQHLADDFVCIESDGSVLDKEQFVHAAGNGPDVADYELLDVDVRIYGDTGLVRATGVWARENGSMGMSRYTDVYIKRHGEWKVVSAQITRTARMGPRGRYKRAKSNSEALLNV